MPNRFVERHRANFNVLSWGGGTNARVEALRRGDLGVPRSS